MTKQMMQIGRKTSLGQNIILVHPLLWKSTHAHMTDAMTKNVTFIGHFVINKSYSLQFYSFMYPFDKMISYLPTLTLYFYLFLCFAKKVRPIQNNFIIWIISIIYNM